MRHMRLIWLKENQQVRFHHRARSPRAASKWVPEPFVCVIWNCSMRRRMLSDNSPLEVLVFLGFATIFINVSAC